jgi:histone H3/H4
MQGSDDVSAGSEADYFRVCSTCRKPIDFGAKYYRCSVSTCNRPRLALFFCSVPCWDAHVPEARHRDAWAEEARAPSREAWEAERRAALESNEPAMEEKPSRERKIVSPSSESELPRDVLVVVSKLKAYVRARSGFNTSDAVAEVISDYVRRLCDRAIENATTDGRKTVLDRDFKSLPKP